MYYKCNSFPGQNVSVKASVRFLRILFSTASYKPSQNKVNHQVSTGDVSIVSEVNGVIY
jgi:hypothetical protein